MATFAERLKEALEVKDIKAAQLARMIDVNEGTISQYKSGAYEPKQKRTEAIAKALDVSIPWLMGGDLPMGRFDGTNQSLPKNLVPLKKIKYVPVLGKIACGQPILAEQNYDGSVMLPESVDADFALRCQGDSMIDANIQDGDTVFIKSTPVVENGEIAAVVIGDEATLKKVYCQNGTLTLIPANSSYEPMVFKKDEINDIRICGKAVAILRHIQ